MSRAFACSVFAAIMFASTGAQACLIILPSTLYGGNSIEGFQTVRTQATPPGAPDPTDYASANPTTIPSGPATLTSTVSLSTASVTYNYFATPTETTMNWSVNLFEDGSNGAFAYHTYRIIFTLEDTATYSFSTNFPDPVLSLPGADYRQQLLNNTDPLNPGLVFSDNSPTNESGVLSAGQYILYGYEQASIGSLTSASGDFSFVVGAGACPVPEPASLTLAGCGAIGLAFGALRRRRQQSPA